MLYKECKSVVKVGSTLSEKFLVNKGLRQGCCISPTLFKIYIEEALKRWKKKCKVLGVQMDDDILCSLLFADDQVIVAEDEEDINYMYRKLEEEYEKWGLEINLDKTQYLTIGTHGHDLQTDKGIIKHTTDYKYLGTTITQDGRDDKDIEYKIRRGKVVVKQLHTVLWNDEISKENKKKMFSTFVESTTAYGSEAWTLSNKLKGKLNATEMMYWRRCCKTTLLDKVRNEEIRNKMDVQRTFVENIERKQLLWYGHMRRMPEERLPQKVWRWQPKNRRKKGRPRRNWQQGVRETMSKMQVDEDSWKNREAWRKRCGIRQ